MWLQVFLTSLITINLVHGRPLPTSSIESKNEALNIDPSKLDFEYKHINHLSANEKEIGNERYLSRQNDKRILPVLADKWSYQPFIEYSNVSPHSKSITQIAFGKSAVEALQKSKHPNSNTQSLLYFPAEIDKVLNNSHVIANTIFEHATNPQQTPFIYNLPPAEVGNQDNHVTHSPPQSTPSLLYYSDVPQFPQGPHENVVYLAPQRLVPNYATPIQTNYYHPDQMYVITHLPAHSPVHYARNGDSQIQNYHDGSDVTNLPKAEFGQDGNEVKAEKPQQQRDNEKNNEHLLVEMNTAKAIIEEYEKHYVKKNVDVKSNGESANSPNPYHISTTPLSITESIPLSRQPIIVPDIDENNLDEDRLLATTPNTIEIPKSNLGIQSTTISSMHGTSRPLSTNFLAPITAGVQLQSAITPHSPTPQNDAVVVEIQKSIPYYLGKFEFFQKSGALAQNKNAENQQNLDIGTTFLKYTIERPPNSGLNHSRPYSTIDDQKQESGQYSYEIHAVPRIKPMEQSSTKQMSKLEKTSKSSMVGTKLYTIAVNQNQDTDKGPSMLPFPLQSGAIVNVDKSIPIYQESNQIVIDQQHVPAVAIKTISNYDQRSPTHIFPQPTYFHHPSLQIPPIFQPKPLTRPQSALLEPFQGATKLLPQYMPHKFHQEGQKGPIKSYAYAPNYKINPHHQPQQLKQAGYKHNVQYNTQQNPHENYQVNHNAERNKKPKNSAFHYGKANAYSSSVRTNDYDGMKQPKGPPFKASHMLQTIHEQLPATQLSHKEFKRYRNPRHSFENTIRLEYGFMPPLIPSIEIDENGNPIEKSVDQ